jgi:hypothetical protein
LNIINSPQYFNIGGLTLEVQSADIDLALCFHNKLKIFQVDFPSSDVIKIRHHSGLPVISEQNHKNLIYRLAPWEVFKQDDGWEYRGFVEDGTGPRIFMVAKFDTSHENCDIYHAGDYHMHSDNIDSITLFPTDQILLARVLPPRGGIYMHASGMVVNGHGLAFVGHSEAGKTTMARLLQDRGEILCDDRVILRRWPDGFKVHGTWSHGDIPVVSPNSAPLQAVLLLEQAPENRLIRLEPSQVVRALPQFVIKPLVTRDWWEQVLDTIGHLARAVPVYRLRFDKSGRVWDTLQELL